LEKYRQSNPGHDAELLANVGVINLQFMNDLAAAENVLSQLRAMAAQNDAAAAEQEKILAEMIERYGENFGIETNADVARQVLTAAASSATVSLFVENSPNPFNPETLIRYEVPDESTQEVSLIIFNALGQRVRILVNERKSPGSYSVSWDGRDDFAKSAASGVYLLHVSIGNNILTRKLMLLR
jgi:hypothetical protein